MRTLGIVALLLGIAGCATFVKEGATEAEYEKAAQECQDFLAEGFSSSLAASFAHGASGPYRLIECMKSKGWRFTDGTPGPVATRK
jgi:hypothetical protein